MALIFSGIMIPVSTIDWYGRSASVIFFNGCNFNCLYCSNVEFIRRASSLEPFFREKKKKAKNKCLFSWNDIPGIDTEKLIEFLRQNYDIDWVKTAKINKINDKIIRVFSENYLFSWDEIAENDRLVEFLRQNYDIDWVKRAKINKIDDGRTINLSAEKHFLSLKLNNEKTKVNLKIDENPIREFITKTENGALNVYIVNSLSLELNYKYLFSWDEIAENDRLVEFLRQNYDIDWVKTAKINKIDDGRTINLSAEKHFLSLKLNNEKTKVNLKIDENPIREFITKTENDKLKIYKITKVILKTDGGRIEKLKFKVKDGELNIYDRLKLVSNPLEPTYMKENVVDIEEIEKQIFDAKSFISAIVFSGGEPTTHPRELEHLAKFAKGQGLLVGIETNGYYPDYLAGLIEKKLVDKIFLDIKVAPDDAERYSIITGRRDIRDAAEHVLRSLALRDVDIEVRTTIFRSFADVVRIAKFLAERDITYVIQQGIPEYAPNETIRKDKPFTRDELVDFAKSVSFLKDVRIRTREKGEERII